MIRQLAVQLVFAVTTFLVVCGSDRKTSASAVILPVPAHSGLGAVRSIAERNVEATGWPLFVIRVGGRTMANGDVPSPDGTIRELEHSPQLLRLLWLLEQHPGDKVILLRDGRTIGGTAFAIVEPVLVQKLWELFLPTLELGRQEEKLASRPNELGRLTGEYARNRAALFARRPARMTAEAFDALVDQFDDDKTGQIGMDADLERDFSQLRGQKRALATAQDLLGKDQAEWMVALQALRDEEARLNDEFQTKARALLDEAVTSGAAEPIDP